MSGRSNQQPESVIAGRRVTLIGKLASMTRRNAEQLIRAAVSKAFPSDGFLQVGRGAALFVHDALFALK